MIQHMKSKMVFYKTCSIAWRVVLVAAVLVGCAYVVTKEFSHTVSLNGREQGPRQVISADRSFTSHIYFNNIVGETGTLDVIASSINRAQYSIEIAVFSFASSDLKKALYAANKRGVKVTLVLDRSKFGQHDLFLSDLPSGIQRVDVGTYDPDMSKNTVYMHDKFMIVDRGRPSQEMITGSLNFTTLGEKYNQSFLLFTKDPDIISIYGKEFDLLKSRTSGIKKLGDVAYSPWAATIDYSDSYLQIWFSPGFSSQSIKYQILKQISSAKKSVDVIMWYLTDQQIASELVKKAKKGIKVRIIAEAQTANTKSSSIPYLQAEQRSISSGDLEVVLDTKLGDGVKGTLPDDFAPFIHHHLMIVDGTDIVFGSGNWSLWGFYENY